MKKVFYLLFLSIFTFPVIAQEESSLIAQEENNLPEESNLPEETVFSLSETVLRNISYDNWYVSAGPSINLMFGEQDKLVSPSKRLKFGGGFSVGKWFNSNTGLSFNVIGGSLRGYNQLRLIRPGYYTTKGDHHDWAGKNDWGVPMGGNFEDENGNWDTKYKEAPETEGQRGFWQDFNFGAVTVDMMSNLSNFYRKRTVEDNRFDLIASAGVGVNYAFDNGATTPSFLSVVGRLAIRANYNLTKDIDIYVEPAAYITDPEFDGYKGTAVGDLYTRVAVGVQYTFNKKGSSGKLTIDELDRLNRRVNENRNLIDKLGGNLPAQDEKSGLLPEYIRFVLDSYRVGQSEYSKIEGIANFLKNNPDAKLLLVGYADKLTGSSIYNYNLSKKRAIEVRNELQRLGVSSSRLFTEWKGDKEQPFTVNEWNRVVIMVERR